MISDSSLYTLAIFLGSAAMLLIVLYHFLEVNTKDTDSPPALDEKASLEGTGVGNAVGAMASPEAKNSTASGGGKAGKSGKAGKGEED